VFAHGSSPGAYPAKRVGRTSIVRLGAGPFAGWLANRVGSKVPLVLGTALTAASFALLAVAHSQEWHVILAVLLLGAGIGTSFASMANLIVDAAPQHQTGEATGMNTIMRTVGGAFGGQIAAAIVTGHVIAGTGQPAESGFTTAFAMGAIALTIGIVAALAIPDPRGRALRLAGRAADTPARG